MDPAKTKPMDRETERALIRRAQDGDQQAKMTLLDQHNRWIWKTAIGTKARGLERDDLLQIGRMAFLVALDQFDFSFNVKLSTFAYRIVAQKVHQQAFQCGNIWLPGGARTTNQKAVDATFKVGALENAEIFLHGRESIDLEKLCRAEDITSVRLAVARLPERERQIVGWRMEGKTLKEIGEMLGLVRERIRQIELVAHKLIAEWIDEATQRPRAERLCKPEPEPTVIGSCEQCGQPSLFKRCYGCRKCRRKKRAA